jgi:hypothetical protein
LRRVVDFEAGGRFWGMGSRSWPFVLMAGVRFSAVVEGVVDFGGVWWILGRVVGGRQKTAARGVRFCRLSHSYQINPVIGGK